MRKIATIAAMSLAAGAMGLGSTAALAQDGQSSGERILRGVLESLLGTDEEEAEAQDEQPVYASRIEEVLAHPRRDEDRARDQYRHPAETLAFFRVEPGMTVVDYMPASGWYSRILIPYLGLQGTYVGLNPELHPGMTGYWDMYRDARSRIPADARQWVPEAGARVIGANSDDNLDALAGRADRVLIFREIHNMRRFGWFHDSVMAARRLLKDGGLLGVVQHRADPGADPDYTNGDNGYQREADVIALFSAYGFDLIAQSEINANPNDPADWETGVWSLPPSYRGAPAGSRERARRAAIGESDRMTLLFRKRG